MRFAPAAALLLAACQAQAPEATVHAQPKPEAEPRPPVPPPAAEPYGPALARGIAATRPYEVEGRPCLAKVDSWPPPLGAQELRRQRVVQSDSHWLNRFVRERYGPRLAYSGLHRRDGRWVHIVALTGSERIAALRLGARAADVPVEIVYDAPWSLEEVLRRRTAGNPAMLRLVPDAQGEGYMESPEGGWVLLQVYSPGGEPRVDVLAHCDALRRAYRLPVLIEFVAGRIVVGEVPLPAKAG